MSRRSFLATSAVALASMRLHAAAPPYPNKPVRLVVPYTPGGGADGLSRMLGQELGRVLGQTIVIDNKPGANTMLGSSDVARSAADGYSLLHVAGSFITNPSLYRVPYDTLKDLTPVALLAIIPLIIVCNPRTPYKTINDIVAASRAKPGSISYASYGLGSLAHLAGELLEHSAGIEMLHVPYKGSAPALQNVMGGQVDIMFSSIEPALQMVRQGKVEAVAVLSSKRIPSLPDVPTAAESIPGFEVIGWNGIVAPAATPPAIVARLNAATSEVLRMPEIMKKMASQGLESRPMSPEAFGAMLRAEHGKWAEVVKKAGVKVE